MELDQEFITLEEVYSYLEAHALDFQYEFQIGDLFRVLRDKLHEAKLDVESIKAQWEVDVFNFVIKENELKSKFSGTDENGKIFSYPDLKNFTTDTYAYISQRATSVSNPLLRARYSHLLWLSPEKHQSFAKVAVDAYFELIDIYEVQDMKDSPPSAHHYGLDVLRTLENAYRICKSISYRLDDIKNKIKQVVHEYSYKSTSSFVLRRNLIEIMLKEKKLFTRDDYESLPDISHAVATNLITARNNLHAAIDMLRLNVRIYERLGKDPTEWVEQIAKNYEALMVQAESNNNLASTTFCQQALKEYKKIRNQKKVEELERKFIALKSSAQLHMYETTIDLTEHVNNCLGIAKKVAKRSGEEIIKILMLDKSLLPRYKALNKRAEKEEVEFLHKSLFPTELMDRNGNPIQHFTTPEEKRYFNILGNYVMEINYNRGFLIDRIFMEGARAGKLSAAAFLNFLGEHSWLGKNLTNTVATKPITYNWLNLIAPSIYEYFAQLEAHLNNPAYPPNFILCIDSLALKFEGLFRDICRLSNITTCFFSKDNAGRDIVQEKDIHALLYEDKIKELFDEDDLLLFRALLIEKAAFNLRHSIAHSLLLFQEYGFNHMNLLLLTLLRIGKYNLVLSDQKEKTTD